VFDIQVELCFMNATFNLNLASTYLESSAVQQKLEWEGIAAGL